jgi:hypothetical protein
VLAFKVEIDGEEVVTAGFEDWTILALHVNASRGNQAAPFDSARNDEAHFSVGGLSEPDSAGVSHHVRWNEKALTIGSRVTVTVMEVENPDTPLKRYRSDAKVQECPFTEDEMKEMRFRDYLDLKKEFEGQCAQPLIPADASGAAES